METVKHGLGTLVGVMIVILFTTGIIALVLSLASEQMPGLKSMAGELRCAMGVAAPDSDCWAERLDELDAERDALRKEQERLDQVIAAQDFVFIQGGSLKSGVSLVVGALYADATRQTGLIRAFCWAIIDEGGLDPRVGLAVLHSDGRIVKVPLKADDRSQLGLSLADIHAARRACPFPGVS